jgi:hypothetical protein
MFASTARSVEHLLGYQLEDKPLPRKSLLRGRLSTVDLLVKKACFVIKEKESVLKAADIN